MIIIYLLCIFHLVLGEDQCCQSKEVTDGSSKVVYDFKEKRPGIEDQGCKDGCVYTKDGEDYCFGNGGDSPVECNARGPSEECHDKDFLEFRHKGALHFDEILANLTGSKSGSRRCLPSSYEPICKFSEFISCSLPLWDALRTCALDGTNGMKACMDRQLKISNEECIPCVCKAIYIQYSKFTPGCTPIGPIYLMFGGVSDQVPQEEIYSPNKDIACAKPIPKIPVQYLFNEHVVFVHNSEVYICGGISDNTRSICISQDLSDDGGWETYDNSGFGRRFQASIVMQNRVYMIGGASIVGPLNIWSPLPLQDPPVFQEVHSLDYHGGMGICLVKLNEDSFIALGGWNTFTDVKKYTISAQTTSVLPSLPKYRTWPGCEKVEKDGKVWIVVAGGYYWDENGTGNVVAESVRLDLYNGDAWEQLGNLNVPRWKSEMVSTEYGLMMLGSGSGYGDIKSVEVLDWNTKQWNLYDPSLQYQRNTLEATVQVPADLLKCRRQ